MTEGDAEGQARNISRLLAGNARFVERFDGGSLKAPPLLGLAILTCMDARIVVEDIFELRAGDVHVIRNAGAVASDDAIRSLVLSRHELGTREIVVLGHTRCGLHGLREDELRERLARETGQPDALDFGSFEVLDAHVERQAERIRSHPWLGAAVVHGLVYEVETGRVREATGRN